MAARRTRLRESAARETIDNILVHLGWNTDEQDPNCDVYTERPKLESQLEALDGYEPDYVLYEAQSDRPIAIVEAKKPGETLSSAVDYAVEHYAVPLGVDIVFATDGTLCETYDIRSSRPLLLDGEPVTDLISQSLLLRFANEGPELTYSDRSRHTKQELIAIFAKANELLRKEGLRAGVERFSEFANLLFLKLISEVEAEREDRGERRQLEARYCWESFALKSAEEMLDYINDTILPRLVASYNDSGEVFQERLQIQNATNLREIVLRLSELSLLEADSDVKGDAFEYFLKNSITVGNDLGEHFTPRYIVKLVVELVDPKYGETVYDPCCGTGGFLIEAFRHISQSTAMSKEIAEFLETKTIYGRELTATARIAKMNMILAGDGHTNIFQQDALSEPVDREYDVVLTNFPFSQKTDYSQYYGLDTEDANPVFLKHALDACKEGGRVGVIVPEGLLFGESQGCVSVRKYLVDNFDIEGIIALHEYVFRPYAGQPTSVLILRKRTHGDGGSGSVWFYAVEDDGFEQTARKDGRPARGGGEDDLVELRRLWPERADGGGGMKVQMEVIRANGYKLAMGAYEEKEEGVGWVALGGKEGVCNVMLGATPSTKRAEYWGGGLPWATISDMKTRYVRETERTITELAAKETSVKRLPEGTVLLSFKLSIGKTAIAGTELFTNEAIVGLVPKDGRVLAEYLYHLLPVMDLEVYSQRASKGRTLNKKIIEAIRIPVPPIGEQEQFIASMNELEARATALREEADSIGREMTGRANILLAGP